MDMVHLFTSYHFGTPGWVSAREMFSIASFLCGIFYRCLRTSLAWHSRVIWGTWKQKADFNFSVSLCWVPLPAIQRFFCLVPTMNTLRSHPCMSQALPAPLTPLSFLPSPGPGSLCLSLTSFTSFVFSSSISLHSIFLIPSTLFCYSSQARSLALGFPTRQIWPLNPQKQSRKRM